MKREDMLKLMVLLAALTIMLSTTALVGRIALMNGASNEYVKSAMTITLIANAVVCPIIMLLMFSRINRRSI